MYAKYKENIVLAGDMNCCLRKQDRSTRTHLNDKSRLALENVVNKFNLKDTWASLSNDPGFTYIDKRHGTKSRLDYLFVNNFTKLSNDDVCISVCPCGPDHSAVIVKLHVSSTKRGRGYWKMNNELLENQDFNTNVSNIINDVRNQYKSQSHAFIWEHIKIKIKEMAIKLSVNKSKSRNRDKCQVQKELDEINAKIIGTKGKSEVLMSKRQELEQKLSDIYTREAKGAQLRSKVKYVEEGEKSIKFFNSMEKFHQNNNVIESVELENGEVVYGNKSIISECCRFYKDLFSSQNINEEDINNYVANTKMPRLNDVDQQICDEEITESEVYDAIVKLKHNKSPGLDGITSEFYQKHWNVLCQPFMLMLREAYRKGELPTTLNQSVITIIFKKGNRQLLKNYRPISLGNYD